MQTRSNNTGEEQKQEALTNGAPSVTLEMKKQLAEAIMNLTSPQAAYVLRRLQCLLQSEN
mgnify:CR=1 FL=1